MGGVFDSAARVAVLARPQGREGTMCEFHRQVVANMRHLDHVGDRDSDRVAESIRRQCPQCRGRSVVIVEGETR